MSLGGRDWGTWAYDSDRDMLYVYAGGHVAIAAATWRAITWPTDRWEISDPTEVPGLLGHQRAVSSGLSYSRRPWAKKHIWNGHAYDPGLKKTIMGSVNRRED